MHFSPRPNRAHEIAWNPWGANAFERAQAESKPVLLSISAVWCHWCHVMDETSYSDPGVIAAINEHYVPVRVDNDERPDVNARYNQGGWPTTAFLTPEGLLIAGATYLPPNRMQAALNEVAQFYQTNRSDIAARSRDARASRGAHEDGGGEIAPEIVQRVRAAIEERFDEQYAGFGEDQKFPMTDVLEFLFFEYIASGDQRLYDMLARTMLAMGGGGMYDPVEGGFFRYSTTRDWSVPHFEKMTEDHAALIRILAMLVRKTRSAAFRTTLVSATGYVRSVLYDEKRGLFRGSQDADETYYALPLDERRKLAPPYVDPTSYGNWSAAMAAACIAAGSVLEEDALIAIGARTLDVLHGLLDDRELLFHVQAPGEAPRVRGLLTDQAAYLRALIDAHMFTGEPRFYERAIALASAVIEHLQAPAGGFYDHASIEETVGALEFTDRPITDNALMADSLLRLAAMNGGDALRAIALRSLAIYATTYARAGIFAASYARAVRRALTPAAILTLTGTPAATEPLREPALALSLPLLDIHTRDARGGEREGFGYLCVGTACAPPAADAAELVARAKDYIPVPHAVQVGGA